MLPVPCVEILIFGPFVRSSSSLQKKKIYLTGGLTALTQFASKVTGGEAKVCKTLLHKVVHLHINEFSLVSVCWRLNGFHTLASLYWRCWGNGHKSQAKRWMRMVLWCI